MCLTFEKEILVGSGESVCDILLDGQLQIYITKKDFDKIKELMEW